MSNSPPEEKGKAAPAKEGSGYRGGIFDQIDVPAVTSFTACLLLFILALVGIRNVDYSKLDKPSLEQISERVARIIMPLKPPGKPAPKPEPPAGGNGRPRRAAGAGKGDATALARIERSRATVAQQITQVQERITKAAVLSILSGKGPGTTGRTVGRAPGGKGGGDRFAGFGDLDARMGSIEGLTKYDGKKGDFNREGSAPARRNGEADAQTSGLDNMAKGFATAKSNIGSKMGVANLETPVATDRSAKFTGNRSPSDVAAFIARKQATVSLLYEERLKSNPAMEGKITVVMVIEEDGTISNVSVLRSETTLDDPDFTEELLRRIKRWIFPPSTGGPVEMKSPFVFRPA
jgi:TonB family protein